MVINSVIEPRVFQSGSLRAHIKGRCLQRLTNRKHGETLQSSLLYHLQLFFNNMKNSNTSSRPKATLLLQQKPGRNAGRKLLTLLMCKFMRSYKITLLVNINGQHSDHTMSLYYGTDVWGRSLPQCPSFHRDIKLV